MSGLQSRADGGAAGIDVREQGNALRVATNTPHLVSLGTGRLSTAVTLHPIKQGRVTIGSDPSCEIRVAGTGVCALHCRVECSGGVVTLYPLAGSTLLDGLPASRPTRLSQGSMLTIGRSNYLRFNHPEEAKLMKSVLPDGHLSMAPIQYTPNEECSVQPPPGFVQHKEPVSEAQYYQQTDAFKQKIFNDASLNALNRELDMTLKEMNRRKPPVAPRKPYKDLDQISDSNSDQDSLNSFGNVSTPPKTSSIMAKVSKFEYYAKSQQKMIGRSQFYTNEQNVEYSPKVFSSNSLTVNTPARDVLGGKNAPTNYRNADPKQKIVALNENNAVDIRNCSYQNVMIKNKITKIDDIVKNFDDRDVNLKKVNNVDSEKQGLANEHTYKSTEPSYLNEPVHRWNEASHPKEQARRANEPIHLNQQARKANEPSQPEQARKANEQQNLDDYSFTDEQTYGKIRQAAKYQQPSASFDRNPQFSPPPTSGGHVERSVQAESMRLQAYRDRVEEQKQQETESARLEEILSMCAEYEKQITCGTPTTPNERRSQNKIITNGSLPRSIVLTNPNFVQTGDGYFKFDTSQNRLHNTSMSKSLPMQRNLSNYENIDIQQMSSAGPDTPEITLRNPSRYENVGRMDEIGIPITEHLSSPITIRKLKNQETERNTSNELPRIPHVASPIASPYENVFYGNKTAASFKPTSPSTQSPRTRIKTTFAHKSASPPQYFVFPTPPPIEDDTKMLPQTMCTDNQGNINQYIPRKFAAQPSKVEVHSEETNGYINRVRNDDDSNHNNNNCLGIEKQLSLDEEIPMIDDSDLTNDLECRLSQVSPDLKTSEKEENESPKSVINDKRTIDNNVSVKSDNVKENMKFEEVRKELIADIPELDEFERDLDNSKRERLLNKLTNEMRNLTCIKANDSPTVSQDIGVNVNELSAQYDSIKESRRHLLSEIHELKCKMSEIRKQEDDILRELEMEKALIKGEYDSEIAILNIEQKNKRELTERARRVEEEIKDAKLKQEARQKELKERVEIATLQVERLEESAGEDAANCEELQNAHDILDNETKLFEDLEFQHLEAESELLAYREDLQNEIMSLTKKIDSQRARIMTLKSEANDNLTSALEETRVLQAEYVQLLNKVEELTIIVQSYEKQLKEIAPKLNLERAQSPLSTHSTDNAPVHRDFNNSVSSSDSDDINYEMHQKNMNDKFNAIDRMSQSMIVDLGEKRNITDLIDSVTIKREAEIAEEIEIISLERKESSPCTTPKEKKGFWERNFDSLSRLKKDKKKSPPPKVDIMSQSLNENMFFNNENIESEYGDFNSLKLSKNKNKQKSNGVTVPVKSTSSSKIPTFSALGKIMKKDSFGKKSKEGAMSTNKELSGGVLKPETPDFKKNRFVKNSKSLNSDNKYSIKAKHFTPENIEEDVNESGIETENERSSYADSLEGVIEDLPPEKLTSITEAESPNEIKSKLSTDFHNKVLLRKSCGDEPGIMSLPNDYKTLADSGKVPSQDDIDRISKVRINAPLVPSEADKNSLGRKTLDSLMEIERNRLAMLEEQGCQLIENEREKMSELKRRVANETKLRWESERESKNELKNRHDEVEQDSLLSASSVVKSDSSTANCDSSLKNDLSIVSDDSCVVTERASTNEGMSVNKDVDHATEQNANDALDALSSTTFPDNESSGIASSSIEELQSRSASVRRRVERRDRPLSDTSDASHDNSRSSVRGASQCARADLQRPLTRYLPIDRDDLDLRHHILSAGHQVELCPHVTVDGTSCRGYLHKLGAKFHAWSKRWFVFDRDSKTFIYYSDKSERKPRGGAYFQVIEEVYLDHGNTSRSPSPQTTFVVKTRQRRYCLMAPSGAAARIWIDVIFTGAQGYLEYLQ